MRVNLKLPYENAARLWHVWAHEEESIDFRRDGARALRCTMSFAAEELEEYLTKLGHTVTVGEEAELTLALTAAEGDAETFRFENRPGEFEIHGFGRPGILYGVYEFLERQGVRWYSFTEDFVPAGQALLLPEDETVVYENAGLRGFQAEGPLKECEQLYLWMARNRMNVSASKPHTAAFQRKLCMVFQAGGHIFEGFLHPRNRTPEGELFLTAHRDWYGVGPETLTEDSALRRQFCTSNPELTEYLCDVLLDKVKGSWSDGDLILVWGFDTWGKSCECEKCRRLGNGSDKFLKFASALRERTDRALASGELDHAVRYDFCAYEGTNTLEAPENGVPENLRTSGDVVAYYPILRCYAHPIDDPSCSRNRIYAQTIPGWKDIPVMLGEYYNVSKFEDLPLLFTATMQRDFRYYRAGCMKGMLYMHLPMHDWGVKTLTQTEFCALSRNADTDVEALLEKYFADLYGVYAADVRKAYDKIEEATRFSASWRAWMKGSILTDLVSWDGKRPAEPLADDGHFFGKAAGQGLRESGLLDEALRDLREIRRRAEAAYRGGNGGVTAAVNPAELRRRGEEEKLLLRLSEDIRGVRYGADTWRIVALFTDYYERLYRGEDTEELWNKIDTLANAMEEYLYCLTYDDPKPGIITRSALDRAQVQKLYYRCLAARNAGEA